VLIVVNAITLGLETSKEAMERVSLLVEVKEMREELQELAAAYRGG